VRLGTVNGTYGTAAFIVGALLGGLFAARLGLRRSLFVLALAANVPHATYLYLSQVRPETLGPIAAAVMIEKLGYGFGSVGHMLYMMQQVAPGPYKTAHYAFATGIMGLCMMSTGMASGALQEAVGYQGFFVIVIAVSALPLFFAWKAPFPVSDPMSGIARRRRRPRNLINCGTWGTRPDARGAHDDEAAAPHPRSGRRQLEQCLPFWVDRLGFAAANQVPLHAVRSSLAATIIKRCSADRKWGADDDQSPHVPQDRRHPHRGHGR
jgi:MFS family permease